MNGRPATPAPGLIDGGMPKLYALDLSDLPDANTTDRPTSRATAVALGLTLSAALRRNNYSDKCRTHQHLPGVGCRIWTVAMHSWANSNGLY